MAFNITIDGSSVIVTDTETSKVVFEKPKKDYFFDGEKLNGSILRLYDTSGTNSGNVEAWEADIDVCQVEGAAATDANVRTFQRANLGFNAAPGSSGATGWAQYKDDQYTSSSPLVIPQGSTVTLGNNAASVIESQLPDGVSSFYDESTNEILGISSGDALLVRIDVTAFTSSQNGLAKVRFDIAGSQGVILNKTISFPKGTGLSNANEFSSTSFVYSLDTFVANGCELKIESITGQTSIFDVNYVVGRWHKTSS